MLKNLERLGQAKNALIRQHEVIANNLANMGTTGYKKDIVAFHDVLEGARGTSIGAVMKSDVSSGEVKLTNNPLDLALQGEGYFSVQTPEGIRYTRDGSFDLSEKGLLVDSHGFPVLGEKGVVSIAPELKGEIVVGVDGKMMVGDVPLGKLLVTRFNEGATLTKVGQNLFQMVDGQATPSSAHVIQGHLEMSTVSSVQEMIEMLDALRLFEANHMAGRMQDEVLGKAIRDLA